MGAVNSVGKYVYDNISASFDNMQTVRDAVVNPVARGVGEFSSGLDGVDTSKLPKANPVTANAVATASDDGADPRDRSNYPTAYRAGMEAAGGFQMPGQDVGGVGSGIQQFNVPGQSPVFTNMGRAGVNDLNSKGLQLPSVPGFLRGVAEFGRGVGAQPGYKSTGQGGSGARYGGGMVHPSVLDRLTKYDDEAAPFLKSGGIVDRLRGRQILRQRERLVNDTSRMMNADTADSLASARWGELGVSQQNANTTLSNNLAMQGLHKYQTDASTANSERSLLPHLPDIIRGQAMQQAAKGGNIEDIERAARIGKFEPADKAAKSTTLMDGRILITMPDGTPRIYNPDELDPAKQKARAGLVVNVPGK